MTSIHYVSLGKDSIPSDEGDDCDLNTTCSTSTASSDDGYCSGEDSSLEGPQEQKMAHPRHGHHNLNVIAAKSEFVLPDEVLQGLHDYAVNGASYFDKEDLLGIVLLLSAVEQYVYHLDFDKQSLVQQGQVDLTSTLTLIVRRMCRVTNLSIVGTTAMEAIIRIAYRIGMVATQLIGKVAPILQSLLCKNLPSDIRIEAASVLASFCKCLNDEGVDFDDCNASVVISILSTGLVSVSDIEAADILHAMSDMVSAKGVAMKMARRRCTIMGVTKHTKSHLLHARTIALSICCELLHSLEMLLGEEDNISSVIWHDNYRTILTCLVQCLECDPSTDLRIVAVNLLCRVCKSTNTIINEAVKTTLVLKVLFTVATSSANELLSVKCAELYIQVAPTFGSCNDVLLNVSEFVINEYAIIRYQALDVLEEAAYWNPIAMTKVIKDSPLLEDFCVLIANGSVRDCTQVTQILRLLSKEQTNQLILCQSKPLIHELIHLVTADTIVNKSAYISSTDVLLRLMSNNDNLKYFCLHSKLQAWMESLANKTSDEVLKEQLMLTCVRLSISLI